MARTKRKVNPIIPALDQGHEAESAFHVAGYVRLSIEDSGKPGTDTIESQRELVLSYISQQEDMRLHDLYCDNGRTGTNFDRPEFERLMNDVRSGIVNCIVVKDLSRFGRNYKEAGYYLEHIFPYLGVRFVAINDHFDTANQNLHDGYIVPLTNILKNKRCLGGGFNKKPLNSTNSPDSATYGFYSTRPTKR